MLSKLQSQISSTISASRIAVVAVLAAAAFGFQFFATLPTYAAEPLTPNSCDELGICEIRDDIDKSTQTVCSATKDSYKTRFAQSANTTQFSADDIDFAVYRACFIGTNAKLREVNQDETAKVCNDSILTRGTSELNVDLPRICAEAYGDLSILQKAATTPAAKECTIDEKARFLTMPAWYRGIVDTKECEIHPSSVDGNLGLFVQILSINIIDILLNIIAYVSVAFTFVGGMKFITSNGDPAGRSSAITTLRNSLIGLIISIMSIGIVNFIAGNLI